MTRGGLREALARALVWVGMARNGVDERGFAAIRRLRDAHPTSRQMALADFKALVREQYLMLIVDEEAALAAIPGLLPESREERRAALEALRGVMEASGDLEGVPAARMARVAALFGGGEDAPRGPGIRGSAQPSGARAEGPAAQGSHAPRAEAPH